MTWQWYFKDFRLGNAEKAAEWLSSHIDDGTLSGSTCISTTPIRHRMHCSTGSSAR